MRYEIGICIATGHIVWVNGGYPCGEWPDLRIAKDMLIYYLNPGEKCIADGGYNNARFFVTPDGLNNDRTYSQKLVRSRHETVNTRIKYFNVLQKRFRHNIEKHAVCFYAVANIVQILIETKSLTGRV